MNNRIFVLYIGVQGIRSEDIPTYVNKITSKIIPTSVDGEFIVIPEQSPFTRIECINPIYITNEKLISEHTLLMQKLNEKLNNQLTELTKNDK